MSIYNVFTPAVKWLIPLLTTAISWVHPYYVSVFEVHHNPDTKTLQVAVRVFADDLEEALMQNGYEKLFIGTELEKEAADSAVAGYLMKHIRFEHQDGQVNLTYIGKESELDAIWCYLESPVINRIDSLYIFSDLLIEPFPAQNNIIHTQVNGMKRSIILKKGKTEASISYTE